MEEKIIEDYKTKSINYICKKYKIGKLKIKEILLNHNIDIRVKGGVKKHKNIDLIVDIIGKKLSCKKCGKEFNDVENKSGVITNHMKTCSPEIIIPNKLFRSNFKKNNGTLWHLQWFNLIDKTNRGVISCPECDWVTNDVLNKSGSLTKHVEQNHGSIDDFTKRNPEYVKYFKSHQNICERKNELSNEGSSVKCKICGESLKIINNTHLRKHNITLSEYKLKYGNEEYVSKMTKSLLIDSYNKNLKHHENNFKSKAEKEIIKIISETGFDVINNDKKILGGIEVDIVIPELKICFEYNGLYYHRETMGKDKNYHLNKQKKLGNIGYQLYHIFEDEWIHNKELCISKIKHIIGKNDVPIIYARKLTIKKIDNVTTNEFLFVNHMLGEVNGITYSIGGFYNDELIYVMTFTKIKDNIWNLTRSCSNIKYRIPGGFSKLLHFFKKEKDPDEIISFAEKRWTPNSENSVYIRNGFVLDKVLKPDYTYVNFKLFRDKRIHKFNCRKKILLKRHGDSLINNSMSESEMTLILGYDKIWDCGLYRYTYKKNPHF